MAKVIGFDRQQRRRRFVRGVLVGLVAAGTMATCMAPPKAHAEPAAFGTIGGQGGGSRIDLYLDAGPCAGEALRAVYVPRGGGPDAVGCWRLRTHDAEGKPLPAAVITVAFLDGDFSTFAAAAVRKTVSL